MSRNLSYTRGIRQERETLPPSEDEARRVERFEKTAKAEGDYWARLEYLAPLVPRRDS